MDIINIFSGGAFAAVLAILGFIYKEFYKVPRLSYKIIRPYVKADEKIVPIIFSNDGHANATNVRLTINCNGPIQEISKEEIPEKFETEMPDQNTLIYKLDRLTSKIPFTTYLTISSSSDRPINKVTITSKEGSGKEYKVLAPLNFSDRVILIIGSAIFGAMIMLGIMIIMAFNSLSPT